MNILGIETSCDDTCAAIITNGRTIKSNVISSSADLMSKYGGVIPELAARSHIESINPIINQALKDAALTIDQIDAIAVTHTPGLNGSLLIGTLAARTLALAHQKPLYPVHHIKSHIYANWLDRPNTPAFPALSLIVSGGHTQLIYQTSHTDFQIIGTTLDDAVGEAFDKAAKILGLPYPGGPAISQLAKTSQYYDIFTQNPPIRTPNSQKTKSSTDSTPHPANIPTYLTLPIPKIKGYDFSFSGLKTAFLRNVQAATNSPISTPSTDLSAKLTASQKADFAASFESIAIHTLVEKLQKAVENYPTSSIILGGGVSANQLLRQRLTEKFASSQIPLFYPQDLALSADNAAMVAASAYFEIKSGKPPTNPLKLEISPHSTIS